jgi:proliferating cell nuclear antigen
MSAVETDAEPDDAFEVIIDAQRLQAFVDSVLAVVDEAVVRFDDEGIECAAVDPANVAMFFIDIEPEVFESYQAPRSGKLGVIFTRFEDVLDVANAGDVVQLALNREQRRLDVRIRGLTYELALIDPDAIRTEPDLPDIDDALTAEWAVSGKALDEAVGAADLVSDHIRFRSETGAIADEVVVEADGDTDRAAWSFEPDDCEYLDVEGSEQSLFSIEYVKDLVVPIGKSTTVTLEFGTEFPIRWEYEAVEGVAVTNVIAPRVQNE